MSIIIPGPELHSASRTSERRSRFGGQNLVAIAANFHKVQVFNAAGSNLILWLTKIWLASNVAQVIVFDQTGDPTTLRFGFNKSMGQAGSTQLQSTSNTTVPPSGNQEGYILIPAEHPIPVEFTDPVRLLELQGLEWTTTIVNTTLVTMAEWYETPGP